MKILNGISAVSSQSTYDLTKALREKGYNATAVIYKSNHLLGSKCDFNLNINKGKIYMMPVYAMRVLMFFILALLKYDIFHFHFGHSLLPFNLDLPILKLLGKKVFMEYHGSDIRRPSVFKEKNKFAYSINQEIEKKSFLKQRRISRYVDGIIVHDHELKEHLFDFGVKIHILPLRIDLTNYKVSLPKVQNETICIVHAPSKKEIKGSNIIIETVEELKEFYNIDFKLVYNMPHEKALRIYQKADLIIDQLRIGSYGMLSIEAMAMGKPVICYLREDLISLFPCIPPIINANETNLKEKIEFLIKNPDIRQSLGIQSRKYVEEYHDSIKVAEKCIEIYCT